MKPYVICAVFCTIGFFAMGMQLGLFGNQRPVEEGETEQAAAEEEPILLTRAKFPDELAPALKGEPVAIAAAFEAGNRPHKMAFLTPKGETHRWHQDHAGYHEEWHTDRVEEAELVVVVGGSRKYAVQVVGYANGAPPITRYKYELEASLVEAKTGTVLAYRPFHNLPRQVRPREAWELTAIGAPVSYHTVFRWAADIAKHGPPATPINTPIVTVVKD
ncbi:MAG: hypothetical protein L0Y71_04000 [Gemmataceae bacterium]|nr:hypothetical protein [Gemmataceae bacterium]